MRSGPVWTGSTCSNAAGWFASKERASGSASDRCPSAIPAAPARDIHQRLDSSIIRIPFDEKPRQMPSSKVLGSTITFGVHCLGHDVNNLLSSFLRVIGSLI